MQVRPFKSFIYSPVTHDTYYNILTDFIAGCHAGGRWPLIVVGRNGRPPDLQQRVHREPLGVFGRVLVLGSAVPADGGALFAEHVQDETTFETHTKIATDIEYCSERRALLM